MQKNADIKPIYTHFDALRDELKSAYYGAQSDIGSKKNYGKVEPKLRTKPVPSAKTRQLKSSKKA